MSFLERIPRPSPKGTVFYLDGECGDGKTHMMLKYIETCPRVANFAYFSPSIIQLNQIAQRAYGPEILKVHNEKGVIEPVRARLLEAIRDAKPSDTLILGTHQALFRDYLEIPRRDDTELVIDENFQIDSFYEFPFGQMADFLNEHLAVLPFNNALYRVVARDPTSLRGIFTGPPSEMLTRNLRELLRYVCSPVWDVFVCAPSWKRVVAKIPLGEGGRDHRVYCLAMLNEMPFKDGGVTIMSANFTQSLTHHYLKHKLRFVPHPYVKTTPAPRLVAPGERLSIRYLLEDRDLSWSFGCMENGLETNADVLDRIAMNHYVDLGQDFLGIVNKDRLATTPLKDCREAKLISPISHGRDDLADFRAIYIGASFNRSTKHLRMLEALGLTTDMVRAAHTAEIIHQNVFRTNLRRVSTDPVSAVISGRYDAEAEAERLKCRDICKLGAFPRTRAVPVGETPTQRSIRHRKKGLFQGILDRPSMEEADIPAHHVLIAYHREGTGEKVFFGEDFKQRVTPILDYVREFKRLHRTEHDDKMDIPYFTPARFSKCELGVRRKENFEAATVIVLDIDDGVPFDVLDDIYWSKAPGADKLAYIAYSTWKHDESRRRYRMVFFLKSPVYSIDEYRHVLNAIVERIRHAGYSDDEIGLDPGVKSANKCYVLPGRPSGSGKDWGFFVKRGCRDQADLERYCLDPVPHLQTATKVMIEREIETGSLDRPSTDVEALAYAALSPIAAMTSGRHEALFEAMWPLVRRHKMDPRDLESMCKQCFGGDPHMMKKVRDNLSTLSNRP